ncbi:elongation factor Ts [Acrasis kona]|uniref:Elongation factor Ts n=1 Tax=Acrasis kona TaxID=1008807 RepID=A0AAW2ZLE0_9EUKA
MAYSPLKNKTHFRVLGYVLVAYGFYAAYNALDIRKNSTNIRYGRRDDYNEDVLKKLNEVPQEKNKGLPAHH